MFVVPISSRFIVVQKPLGKGVTFTIVLFNMRISRESGQICNINRAKQFPNWGQKILDNFSNCMYFLCTNINQVYK